MAIFSKTAQEFGKLGGDFKNLGTNMAGSASAIRDSIAKSGGRLAGLTDWTGKWTVAAARLPVKVVSGTFKAFPVASGIAAVLGTGMVVGSFFRRGAEKRTERELAAQTAGMQQPMYQISPEDYAALQSRMRDSMAGQGQATGHADRVMAKQAAAAGADAKPTADLGAL